MAPGMSSIVRYTNSTCVLYYEAVIPHSAFCREIDITSGVATEMVITTVM